MYKLCILINASILNLSIYTIYTVSFKINPHYDEQCVIGGT